MDRRSHTGPPSGAGAFRSGRRSIPDGVNFSVFSKHSTAVQLLLFDRVDDCQALACDRAGPAQQRTYHYWHAFVPGIAAGQLYALSRRWTVRSRTRACASTATRCCSIRTARCVARPAGCSREAARQPGDNAALGAEERGGRSERV